MPPEQGPVVMVIEQASSFQTETAAGVGAALEPLGIPLVVHVWGEDTERVPRTLVRLIDTLRPRAVVSNPLTRGSAQEHLRVLMRRYPYVPLVSICGSDGVVSLRADNDLGMQLLAEHVVRDCGARRVLVVRGIPGHPDSVERERAVRAGLARLGQPLGDDRVVTGGFDRDQARRAVHQALERDPDVDAVIAFNDFSALGVLDAVTAAGKRVPEDVVVTGFDDETFAAFCQPPLTTVSQDLLQMGTAAGELLLRLLGGAAVGDVRVPVRLLVRGSTRRGKAASVEGKARAGQATKAEPLWHQVSALGAGLALSRRFMACETLEQVYELLCANLSVLGIARAFLVLCPENAAARGEGVLALSYYDGRRQEIASSEPFDVAGLLPDDLAGQLRQGTLMVQPLDFDQTPIGYLVFEPILRQVSYIGELLRMDLARTIDTMRRTARLSERTHQLEQEVATRRAAQQALVYQASHDPLTGLANRVAFVDTAEPVLVGNPDAAMLLVDLARFKDVNDILGHTVGDALLREVANRLNALVGARGTVCRLGGDEFAVFAPGAGAPAQALALAREVMSTLREQYRLDGLTLEAEAVIGVACAPVHARDAATLLQMADIAMHIAKGEHLGVALYDPDEQRQTQRRLALFGELRRALSEHELLAHYQPVVDVASGRVTGVEALVRWAHPTLGLLPPSEFVEVAEQTGLIHDLTTYVLDQALEDCRRWLDHGPELVVAVNLSARRLTDVDLPLEVSELLARHHVPASRLVLEVTETAAMVDPSRALSVLRRLRELGIHLSVDDFGTGHASLAYLSRLPVTALKIDRSFVLSMETDHANLTIVRSTLDLARNLGLGVIAEGVETASAFRALASFGCGQAQGYWLARPGPAADVPAMIEDIQYRLAALPDLEAVPRPRARAVPEVSAVEAAPGGVPDEVPASAGEA